LKESVGIWDSCSNENLVIFMLESIVKGKHKPSRLLLTSVFALPLPFIMVSHGIAGGMPVRAILARPGIGPHSPLKKRIDLLESVDMQGDPAPAFVAHAEVEPLPVSAGVGVNSHVEIVLKVPHPRIPEEILQWPGSDCRSRTDC